MAGEGQTLVEDASLREIIDLYSELQFDIFWIQGEIAKLVDDNPCKPTLIAMLESLEKMIKDFKDGGHEQDVWEHIQLSERASVQGTLKQGPSQSGGDGVDSKPSHGDRSHIPRYVSNDEVHHMSVEDLHSLHFECRDYIHGTDVSTRECGYRTNYVDSSYDIEHGQASFLNTMVDDVCREYATLDSMPTNVQKMFLESSVTTAYERVVGAGPSREFEEPRVTTCPDTTPMDSVPKSVLGLQTHDPTTSALGSQFHVSLAFMSSQWAVPWVFLLRWASLFDVVHCSVVWALEKHEAICRVPYL
eukprot:Gb_26506 [translate_table: standard]